MKVPSVTELWRIAQTDQGAHMLRTIYPFYWKFGRVALTKEARLTCKDCAEFIYKKMPKLQKPVAVCKIWQETYAIPGVRRTYGGLNSSEWQGDWDGCGKLSLRMEAGLPPDERKKMKVQFK